ncbi:MAG TPA: hypothetical protein VE397_06270 [Stellaceae bacterium]|nr:hypothetical protein [Stellaceae bacterium]
MHGISLDPPLESLYRHWLSKKRGRAMPCRADIDPLEMPAEIWPYTMLLDVVWSDDRPRFRYRRVGDIFWRGPGGEPTGRFVDEVLPERAGYRSYVVGIYEEMARRRRPMYTENSFALRGRATPMVTRRISLPLSNDGEAINMVLAGHVFDHGRLARDVAFSLVTELKELRRVVLESCLQRGESELSEH